MPAGPVDSVLGVADDGQRARHFRRDFAWLWFGHLTSAIGDRLHAVALAWISVQVAGSAAGYVLAAGAAGRLLFGLFGGAYADRLDRQRLVVACELACAVAVASLAWLDASAPGALAWLSIVSFVVGALDAFVQPALQASLPMLAPDRAALTRANAWLDVNRRLAMALGPAFTGVLLLAIPLVHFFTLDALTFVAAALSMLALGRHHAWRAAVVLPGRSLLADIGEGIRVAFAHRLLRWGIGQAVVWNLVLTPTLTLGAALLVQQELRAGAEWLGYVLAAYGAGNVLANLVVARLDGLHTARTLFAGAIVAALGWIAFAFTTDMRLLLVVTAITATGGPMADLMLLRIIQDDFDSDQVGRVFSLRTTLSRAAGALGMLAAAGAYAVLGTREAIAAGGLVLLAFALLALARLGDWPFLVHRGNAR